MMNKFVRTADILNEDEKLLKLGEEINKFNFN